MPSSQTPPPGRDGATRLRPSGQSRHDRPSPALEVQDGDRVRTCRCMTALVTRTELPFKDVVAAVGPTMLRYARRRTDPDRAQDVVAEALCVMWRRREKIPAGHKTVGARHHAQVPCQCQPCVPPPVQPGGPTRLATSTHRARASRGRQRRGCEGRLGATKTSRPGGPAFTGLGGPQTRRDRLVLGARPETVSVLLHRAKKRLAKVLAEPALSHAVHPTAASY
jgi:hypothetical protein